MTINQPAIAELEKLVSNDEFQLFLMPTEQCNFRCLYCYENFALGRMPQEVVASVKSLISRRVKHAPRLLALSWYGGEPLLASDIVLEVSNHAKDVCRKANTQFFADITTNGYLLSRAMLSELASAGLKRFQITLAGAKSTHDRMRMLKSGKDGTFDIIWNNLLALRDSGLPIEAWLRINFDAHTYTELDPLIQLIKEELIPSGRFTVFFSEILPTGGLYDEKIGVFDAGARETVLEQLYSKVGIEPYQKELENRPCYAAHANTLLIRSDGSLGKCTVALYDERNCVGSLRPDGTLDFDKKRLQFWLRGLVEMNKSILQCPLNERCDDADLLN